MVAKTTRRPRARDHLPLSVTARNWLVRNEALGTDTGFRIRRSGAYNVLIGNVANRKEFFGIEVEGQGNTILHNTALESTTDLIAGQ